MVSYIQSLQLRAGALFRVGNNTAQISRIMGVQEDAALKYVTEERCTRRGFPTVYFNRDKDFYGNGVVVGAIVKLSHKAKSQGLYRNKDPKGTRVGRVVGNSGMDCCRVKWAGNKNPQSLHRSFLEVVQLA